MTTLQIENNLLPKFINKQVSKMRDVTWFGVRSGVSDIQDVVSEASISFMLGLRNGSIVFEGENKLYRLFQKYVHVSLKKHRSGRTITQRDGSVSYPEACTTSYTVLGIDEERAEEIGGMEETLSYEVKVAVSALETDERFELLKLSALEGWGKYQVANKLGESWKQAENEVNRQRNMFVEEFNIRELV